MLAGPEGVRIFDLYGTGHDKKGRRVRNLQHLGSAENELAAYAEALQKGNALLRVASDQGDAEAIAHTMQRHGAGGTAFFANHSMVLIPQS